MDYPIIETQGMANVSRYSATDVLEHNRAAAFNRVAVKKTINWTPIEPFGYSLSPSVKILDPSTS